MKSPTRSIAVIRRQIARARRDACMVPLHPDTAEWMALLAGARNNCVLEPKEAKAVIRLLGILQDHLEAEIDSDIYHKTTCKSRCNCWKEATGVRVRDAQRKWKAAEDLIKTLTGAKK
jgi:hypothetical protein